MRDTQNENVLYTVKEVARLLKTSPYCVHKYRKTGLLKFIKIGTLKVRKETLEGFLRQYDGYDITDPEHIEEISD